MKDIYWIVCITMILVLPATIAGIREGIAIICLQIFFVCWYELADRWIDENN